MNMKRMMKQAKGQSGGGGKKNDPMRKMMEMQNQMAKVQEELQQQTVESSAGGGKIKVTANGAGDVISIKIDPSIVDPDDVEMLEDLVLSGVRQAVEDGKKLMEEEMGKVTGGLGLPPGLGF